MRPHRTILALFALLAVVATACGSDGSSVEASAPAQEHGSDVLPLPEYSDELSGGTCAESTLADFMAAEIGFLGELIDVGPRVLYDEERGFIGNYLDVRVDEILYGETGFTSGDEVEVLLYESAPLDSEYRRRLHNTFADSLADVDTAVFMLRPPTQRFDRDGVVNGIAHLDDGALDLAGNCTDVIGPQANEVAVGLELANGLEAIESWARALGSGTGTDFAESARSILAGPTADEE